MTMMQKIVTDKASKSIGPYSQAVLAAAGTDFTHVVKATIYVTDMSFYGKINEVYGSYFSDPLVAVK